MDSPSLKGVIEAIEVKGGKVAVEVSEVGEEEGGEEVEVETGPNFLQRSWMPSWMLTMPRCVCSGCIELFLFCIFTIL